MMGNEENKTLYDIYRGILCNNQSFQLGKQAQVEYRFDCPEYAELKEKYHLNEIAGNGTELEHSVRLLKYLAPKLTHSAWYDNSVPCNGLALLEYSLEQPEHGINCLNKSKILEECCLALGIYARRVRMLPYSPFDSDCHVVTEIFDRTLGKWCMLDPTTNGYLVDETGSVLSLLEARERMAQAGFVTFCRADETVQDLHEVAQKEMEWSAYFVKNLFRLQIDAVSQLGETGKWLDVILEHFLVRQWSKAKAEHRITMAPEYAKTENGFEMAKMLPLFQKAVKEAEKELAEEVEFYSFQQYCFTTQWNKLKEYANEKGIQIIGDVPIYVALDSSDAWANPEMLQFDEDYNPKAVAGCPPDAFSAIGQLWGNPLYDWKKLKKDNQISEDEEKRFENEIQKLTDESIKKIEEMLSAKEKDILQV